jgi:phosphoribosyl-AMP cyclohydrolase
MTNSEEFIQRIVFNSDGLVPVIAQDSVSKEVLMLAWMNAEALRLSIQTGRGTYFSRSRSQIWIKGEQSGNTQQIVDIRCDCDSDALVMTVHQHGPACHTGNQTCFSTILKVIP